MSNGRHDEIRKFDESLREIDAEEDTMDLEKLGQELAEKGWKGLQPRKWLDTEFDLIGVKKHGPSTKWRIAVKTMPTLDNAAYASWKNKFETMAQEEELSETDEINIVCFIAQDIAPKAMDAASASSFIRDNRPLSGIRMSNDSDPGFGPSNYYIDRDDFPRQGGWLILVADQKNRKVYGKLRNVEMPIIREIKELLVEFVGGTQEKAESSEYKVPWYRRGTFVGLSSVLFPPLGLYLLWSGDVHEGYEYAKQHRLIWAKNKKIAVTIFSVFLFFGIDYSLAVNDMGGCIFHYLLRPAPQSKSVQLSVPPGKRTTKPATLVGPGRRRQ